MLEVKGIVSGTEIKCNGQKVAVPGLGFNSEAFLKSYTVGLIRTRI